MKSRSVRLVGLVRGFGNGGSERRCEWVKRGRNTSGVLVLGELALAAQIEAPPEGWEMKIDQR